MKIAVLADIHGNYQALCEVGNSLERWNPDLVFVVGDTINRGPCPSHCLQYILQKQEMRGWHIIRGNHEDYVLEFDAPPSPTHGSRSKIMQYVRWNYQQLSKNDISHLKALPYIIEKTLDNGQTICAAHGSIKSTRKGIYPQTSNESLASMIPHGPGLLTVGHTHQPLIRNFKKILIVNAGSVGLPFDGDVRPSYAQIQWNQDHWQASIVRINYNHKAAIQDFHKTHFLSEGGPIAKIILAELQLARPQLSHWARRYKTSVMAGKISLADSVTRHLKKPNKDKPV